MNIYEQLKVAQDALLYVEGVLAHKPLTDAKRVEFETVLAETQNDVTRLIQEIDDLEAQEEEGDNALPWKLSKENIRAMPFLRFEAIYSELESSNRRSENLVFLAKRLASDKVIKEAQDILRERNVKGYLDEVLSNRTNLVLKEIPPKGRIIDVARFSGHKVQKKDDAFLLLIDEPVLNDAPSAWQYGGLSDDKGRFGHVFEYRRKWGRQKKQITAVCSISVGDVLQYEDAFFVVESVLADLRATAKPDMDSPQWHWVACYREVTEGEANELKKRV